MAEEESDETAYRLELTVKSGMVAQEKLHERIKGNHELQKIIVSSVNTMKRNINGK